VSARLPLLWSAVLISLPPVVCRRDSHDRRRRFD
jgi:hypothetical protein